MSLIGLFAMVGLAWLMSSHRRNVSLRLVFGGLLLQFMLAVAVLKTGVGQTVFQAIGDFATHVLGYVEEGSVFVFGTPVEEIPIFVPTHDMQFYTAISDLSKITQQIIEALEKESEVAMVVVGSSRRSFDLGAEKWRDELTTFILEASERRHNNFQHMPMSRTFRPLKTFAFGVLPTIVFFSSLMAILYHVGVMQKIVVFFAWIMQRTLGTSGAESLSAAANVFVGQTEAPLVIRPYVGTMTQSELMAVMVGGFATIAGGVFAAYVQFGIDASHLITASVISAPAALLIAKVIVPETEHSKTLGHVELIVERKNVNVIDAAANGATDGMKLALNVGAMLIAFLALIALVDAGLGWTGSWLGYTGESRWTLATALGYIFAPLAWLMGIEVKDCRYAGQLLGLKMAANEFVAYFQLSEWLKGGSSVQLSERTITIITYALCGFANFSSIGIQLGGIGGIAPQRRSDLARLGFKAMLGGTLAAFMTACIAGILI